MSNAALDQMSDTRRTALGTLLIEREHITPEQLDEALRTSNDTGERLGEVLVRLGWVSEEELARVLADQWQLRYCERSAITFDGRALRRMSWEDASRLEALPIQETVEGAVVVAVAEPTEARLHALRDLLGDRIDFVVVARTALETGLRSDLLARTGSEGQFESLDLQPGPDGLDADAPGSSIVDELAKELTEALEAKLGALRSVVADAQAQHERDRLEIERLTGELAAREDSLVERQETIRSMRQTLLDYADKLDGSD
jgi:hypothetical protein